MIKALVFDAYGTLFDVHSVGKECNEIFPNKGDEISQSWRKKQLEYFFLRQLMERYKPFDEITKDALNYACKENGVELSEENEERLMNAYLELELFEEVESVLKELSEKKLVVFSNGSVNMIEPLVEQSSINEYIDEVISADEIKQYKPTPAAYNHALERLDVKREEVLFMSSNPWDITGAKSFGFNTAWINRKELVAEELNIQPDSVYSDLSGIREWK
ncbi:haloacid dehalogenase, type II [Halobacillus halophilus]|uniref:Haloacid dehalogenase, type II n=1 Tax=Halobacillus halophilus (strain ATCC 35676 / DSM 2266 / JCM 20832 / KCTC 3685 / LMG 17431 / NBRC 102448 / NCIMB 2269) TaxID=866895 RepID=I0JKW4_HALH3|nr:haloacid dehalogenase type II [Halobacillus halophilus]ASF38910.1 haloacid dehalogenase, type II [Halobacillus halophilus]CCG44784.1 haloacid dehalogenase, type II [Halobacillus halophilus DSM 2266]